MIHLASLCGCCCSCFLLGHQLIRIKRVTQDTFAVSDPLLTSFLLYQYVADGETTPANLLALWSFLLLRQTKAALEVPRRLDEIQRPDTTQSFVSCHMVFCFHGFCCVPEPIMSFIKDVQGLVSEQHVTHNRLFPFCLFSPLGVSLSRGLTKETLQNKQI